MCTKSSVIFSEGSKVFFDHELSDISLLYQVKAFKKRASEIDDYLTKNPNDWGKFQSEYNSLLNLIFGRILLFEKKELLNKRVFRVKKLKNFFVSKLRKYFIRGEYVNHSLKKPYGYAGDFQIIDKIYLNLPITSGFDRLSDNYYQMSSICIAVRNRKNDFKKILREEILSKDKGKKLKIMNFASGPCRELKELLEDKAIDTSFCCFDCYEQEKHAIKYSQELLGDFSKQVVFINFNALKVTSLLKKIIKEEDKYDIIYSTGLFDYFDYKVSFKMISTLKKLLKKDGVLMIASVRDKFSNPSSTYMEWVGEWPLIYRSDWEFKKVFLDSGFSEEKLNFSYEQQGILLYTMAYNS